MRAIAPEFRPYAFALPTGEVARLAGVDPSQVLRFDQNMSRKDMSLDGTNPTLLYGYGGFEVS